MSRISKKVMVGDIAMGGGAPVSIQSMTNTDTRNVKATVEQIAKLTDAGCQIVRLAIPDMEAADAFGQIKKLVRVPLVADIHFDYRLAIEAMKQGADKVRINPGNIGSEDRVKAVLNEAKARQIPIRVGVNSGSLERNLVEKYGGVTAEALAESAINMVNYVESLDFTDIVVSLKSSDVALNDKAYRIVADQLKYPLHVGITEAGTVGRGKVKSAIGIGSLLLSGIGDTIRVSLTGDPVNEVIFAKEILSAIGLRDSGINLVSCPTCGRTRVDLEAITSQIERELAPIEKYMEEHNVPRMTVAVMGCAVNGPGEAREADLGVAGGDGKGVLIEKGEIIRTIPEEEICSQLIAEIKSRIGMK
ncbi:MAG: flavodoxin-dependent (E)-4-hydroxy-3-methylbut-2-enyl-diphosphate synthase [Firmicutes bacterium]|nr:flavodoxin-dependent (E)-4-hydroxy-3-methylbut-2-enyl-diphosphate synthase [Bacillota bacterium]